MIPPTVCFVIIKHFNYIKNAKFVLINAQIAIQYGNATLMLNFATLQLINAYKIRVSDNN